MVKSYTYNLEVEPDMWKSRMIENPNPPPDYVEEDYGIQPDVLNSDMDDKSIIDCTWDGGTKVLTIRFENELSTADKTKLDAIVAANE